jgi:RNA polymerase sigma-70 factor (ECF subfamily)
MSGLGEGGEYKKNMSQRSVHTLFLRLYLSHEQELRAFVTAVVPDAAVREDLFQEVAATLWRSFHTYDPSRSFGNWARGVAMNKVRQHRRKLFRSPVTLPEEAMAAVAAIFDRESGADDNGRTEALEACLAELPEKSSQLLDLRYRESLSAQEIAARTGKSPDAIYQTLSRLRRALEICIRRRLSLSPP